MIAFGSAFCGFFTSSPAVATASSPMKEKKIVPAAALTPAKPEAKKLSKWSAWNAVSAISEKSARTNSLIITMIALIRADSAAPRISSSVHSPTRITAGRLMMPPVAAPSVPGIGETDSSWGSWTPNREWVSSLK